MSSISSSIITFEYSGVKFNFIDTPGYADFFGSAASAIEMAELILLVINPHEGVDIVAKKIWKKANIIGKPVIVSVNFMDNANRSFTEIVDELKNSLSPNMAPVIAPIGQAESFKGIIKLLENKAVEDGKEVELSQELKDAVSAFSES